MASAPGAENPSYATAHSPLCNNCIPSFSKQRALSMCLSILFSLQVGWAESPERAWENCQVGKTSWENHPLELILD